MYILGGEFRLPFTVPSGLSTGKVKRFRNFSVTNISLLSCHASEGVTSLIPSKKGEMEKSINWNCLPNEFLHSVCVWEFENYIMALSNCTYE